MEREGQAQCRETRGGHRGDEARPVDRGEGAGQSGHRGQGSHQSKTSQVLLAERGQDW